MGAGCGGPLPAARPDLLARETKTGPQPEPRRSYPRHQGTVTVTVTGTDTVLIETTVVVLTTVIGRVTVTGWVTVTSRVLVWVAVSVTGATTVRVSALPA